MEYWRPTPRLIPQATQVTWDAGTFELTERIPRNAAEIRVVSVRHGRAVGRQLNLPIPELVKRLGTACKLYPEKDAP